MSLQGKVIVITGGSQGMGKAAALRAASEGASVVFSYNASVKAANELVQAIGEDRSIAIQADASKLEDNEKLIKAAVDKFGKIDVIYANAGSMPNDNLERTTPQKFDDAIDLLVKGPYFLAQVCFSDKPSQLLHLMID
jgi:3-oxoacyl-[acyl-carrier protein] reductase